MMGLLEPGHLLVILLIALLVFGPRKLPELGKSLGETLREFRKHTSSVTEEVSRSLDTSALKSAPASEPLPVRTVVAAAPPEHASFRGE